MATITEVPQHQTGQTNKHIENRTNNKHIIMQHITHAYNQPQAQGKKNYNKSIKQEEK